jgi:deoxyribodipyrimidine photo-lyase
MRPAVMWFRRDLRLADNPALADTAAAGDRDVVGLFVIDPALFSPAGKPRRDYLLSSLTRLSDALGGRLVVRRGDPVTVVPRLVREAGAASVHVSADHGPYGRRRDEAVAAALDVPFVASGSPYAVAPGELRNKQGSGFQVFTPYFRAWLDRDRLDRDRPPPEARPRGIDWVEMQSDDLPEHESVAGAGEAAALRRWHDYLDRLASYEEDRDRPDLDATSRMSVHLKYGEIHPRTMLADLAGRRGAGAEAYRRELAWREFCADLLARNPDAAWKPLRGEFERMEYDEPGEAFDAWCAGRTGYPFVDAGMRQLATTGFMHNRVRMVVASFLVKDLHVHWKHGARWFMRNLVDGDLASNSLNWQWVAGCGADPAPYFRIFNPVSQGQKFDPDGEYVRRWVPELRSLAGTAAHEPWRRGGVPGYPEPIVDHPEARREALRRYHSL